MLKIEPQAQTEQNVTVFPVLVRIENQDGLLRPGMNTEVEIHVGQREDVPAIPNAALRTARDVASAAQVLGLSPDEVQRQLAAGGSQSGSSAGASTRAPEAARPGRATDSARAPSDSTRRARPDSAPLGAAARRAAPAGWAAAPAAPTPAAGGTSCS